MSSSWKLQDSSSPEALAQMELAGLGRGAPHLIQQAAAALQSRLAADSEAHWIWAPGRIEIAGKHTDYAGGRSLVAPTEQGIAMIAVPRSDRTIHVLDASERCSFEFCLDDDRGLPTGTWQSYFVTVARRLHLNFPILPRGAYLSFASDLPAAAGLSSSSALIVGVFLALDSVNSLSARNDFRRAIPDHHALAGYLGAVENGYPYGDLEGTDGVGTFGGSEDHTAILCGRPGHIMQYSYSPVRLEGSIRLPKQLIYVIATSGIRAQKTGPAKARYNRLSLLSREAARLWREATGRNLSDLGSILAADRAAARAFRPLVERSERPAFPIDELAERFEHFEQENEVIVPEAAAALGAGDLRLFGQWIDRSMRLAESHLGNQVPETSFLAAESRRLGAIAASAFGAGFGGAVWALIQKSEAEKFKYSLRESYLQAFPQHREAASFLLTKAGPPAMEISPRP